MSAFDLNDPAFVAAYDDLPLWSAPCGLLLLDTVTLRPGMRVLDVGCGTGFPLVELAERLGPTSEVHGIDPWAGAIARAEQKIGQRRATHARAMVGSADDLPFPDAFFDLVVSNLGINNFDAPAVVLAECRRVCRPGAEIALATNLQGTMAELYDAYEAALTSIGLGDRAAEIVSQLVRARTSVADAKRLFEEAGCTSVRVAESSFRMRFADGGAVLAHSFVQLGFRDAWTAAIEPHRRAEALTALGEALDEVAAREGGVTLTVPIACVVARV